MTRSCRHVEFPILSVRPIRFSLPFLSSLPSPGSSLRFYRGIGNRTEKGHSDCSSVLIAARRLQVCSSLIELESFWHVVRVLLDTSPSFATPRLFSHARHQSRKPVAAREKLECGSQLEKRQVVKKRSIADSIRLSLSDIHCACVARTTTVRYSQLCLSF